MLDAHSGAADLLFTNLPRIQVTVVGDLMVDHYLWGDVRRISPEAPVPVVRLQRSTHSPGGAANVAANLASLGVHTCLAGVTGSDRAREDLLAAIHGIDTRGIIAAGDRLTCVKTRVMSGHQQLLRVDHEDNTPIGEHAANALGERVVSTVQDSDALLLSDYAKGTLTDLLTQRLIRAARAQNKLVIVDPKGNDFLRYRGATAITPNRAELALATGCPTEDLDALYNAAHGLRDQLELDFVLLTLSEHGLALIEPQGTTSIPAAAREVFDVSGAGDTVIAVFTAALCCGLSRTDAAHIANLAAGAVVAQAGTATLTSDELSTALHEESTHEQAAKISTAPALARRIADWRRRGERVVFTNGCFDLLHAGHVNYLEQARHQGDRLVVGINTDNSVRALKGPERPIIREADRARVLAALAAVDAVVLFDAPTPLDLITTLRPDVLVKGADYTEDGVVGAAEVRSWGGTVVLVPLTEQRSTSSIVRKINNPNVDAAS